MAEISKKYLEDGRYHVFGAKSGEAGKEPALKTNDLDLAARTFRALKADNPQAKAYVLDRKVGAELETSLLV